MYNPESLLAVYVVDVGAICPVSPVYVIVKEFEV
jgi:hypothetical protein